jgi:hypothetical protein
MYRRARLALALLLLACVAPSPVRGQSAAPTPGECLQGTLPHGALRLICVPATGWNGDLVIFAHGYVAFNEPIDFYHLTFDDVYLPDLVQRLGFAFATTSYRQNGLAILEGADDIRELVAEFPRVAGRPAHHTYLTGASEGGIITTLLVEQSADLFSGGLAGCGPIGSFQKQLNYVGDYRVLFDYFFPGLIPGSPIDVPREVIHNWEKKYVPRITAALRANPEAAAQLIRTSKAAIDLTDPQTSTETTTVNVLWYNVFATGDAVEKLGGNPYGNRGRWYFGSADDVRLNRSVQRFAAEPAALSAVTRYETSGRLQKPLVTLHTWGDEIIPYWHEVFYRAKVNQAGGKVTIIPVARYGHCEFTIGSLIGAFAVLVGQVVGSQPDYSPVLRDVQQSAP